MNRDGSPSSEDSSPLSVVRASGEADLDYLKRLANAHLEPAMALRWLGLLKPAVRLASAAPRDPIVARLGGRPVVPADFVWPMWSGHGPLTFVAELDLSALAATGLNLGLDLPDRGRFLAFYFDGSFDNFAGVVGTWDKESLAGARLIYLDTSRADGEEARTPANVLEYPRLELTALPITTFPTWEHPVLRGEFGTAGEDHRSWMSHPVNAEVFTEALWALHGSDPKHQVGGWADPEQGPVEYEVAEAALAVDHRFGDEIHTAEALQWRLLLQIDSDDRSNMLWGDVGKLYWMVRNASNSRVISDDRIGFTWQCG